MQYTNSNKKNAAIVLTLLFPFAGLIYSLSHWRESWAKNAFWLACIYLGAVFIYVPDGTVLGSGSDAGRYVLYLMDLYNYPTALSDILGQYLIDQYTMDLYQQIMSWLISRFTDNGHVLFAAFATVFGFFYSRNIWYILEKLPNKRLGYLFVLVSLFFLICPITKINGARMWTATHVFVYAMMPYLLERDKSKIWWVFLTPLIHFSFLYVALFAVVWFLLPFRIKSQSSLFLHIGLAVFLVSLLINTLNLNAIGGILAEYSPESYERRIEGYVSQDVANRNAEELALNNWYVGASGIVSHWCYNLLLLIMLPCLKRNLNNNYGLMQLFAFALFFGGLANIMALIPSGGRFQILSQMFKIPLILLVVMNIPSNDVYRKYVNFATLFLLLPFVVEIRKLLEHFSITAVLGNFITVFFWENNMPLIYFIKQMI